MQQGRKLQFLVPTCGFPHTQQSARHLPRTLCFGSGRPSSVPLGQTPLLHGLRWLLAVSFRLITFVHPLLRSYEFVRLPDCVHVSRSALHLLSPICRITNPADTTGTSQVPCMKYKDTCTGSLTPWGRNSHLPLSPLLVLPSAYWESVSTPGAQFSKLNT